jgi:L-ascorbate metabolism protein UlaG (beta-lactamase superfamily)
MQFTYYGQSCFLVELAGKKILFDPFITPNPLAKNIDVNKINADYIFISHGHADHIADCKSIAQRTNALVVCSYEIHEWLQKQGVTNTHPMNTGGKWKFDFGTVKCVIAQHSSGLPDGSYGGNPMGFVVMSDEKTFYYSGDTALTLDMQLITAWSHVNLAIFPIGDNFTMDYIDAEKAADFVDVNVIIGVHYDTFDYIKIDKQAAIDHFSSRGKTLLLPAIGETIEV